MKYMEAVCVIYALRDVRNASHQVFLYDIFIILVFQTEDQSFKVQKEKNKKT